MKCWIFLLLTTCFALLEKIDASEEPDYRVVCKRLTPKNLLCKRGQSMKQGNCYGCPSKQPGWGICEQGKDKKKCCEKFHEGINNLAKTDKACADIKYTEYELKGTHFLNKTLTYKEWDAIRSKPFFEAFWDRLKKLGNSIKKASIDKWEASWKKGDYGLAIRQFLGFITSAGSDPKQVLKDTIHDAEKSTGTKEDISGALTNLFEKLGSAKG